MSRVGRAPIHVPHGVDVRIENGSVSIKGTNGELSLAFHPKMSVTFDEGEREIRVSRPDDQKESRALHGLTRSLINNMVIGVTTYYEKRLEIVGVGYNAIIDGKFLQLAVGFANAIRLPIPDSVICETTDTTHIVVKSADKQAVGQFASEIRRVRPPEPYKGKGVRYQDEHVRRKAGKALAGGA